VRRLVIVEGLPSSGKSTAAGYIAEQLGMTFVDEGSGAHPADYEFHAYLTDSDLGEFTENERQAVLSAAEKKSGGYIVKISDFTGELFDRLLQHKVYDFLPWDTEYPVMLDKWREFVQNSADESWVFNCVFLQNPMCETMMRFGFDEKKSAEYISAIADIIKPFSPAVVYLRNSDIRTSMEKAITERGKEWLDSVIDYHCNGEYGKSLGLSGFDGYIAALEERQRREVNILSELDIESIIIDDAQNDWNKAYSDILAKLK
jgi:hypothetical protein